MESVKQELILLRSLLLGDEFEWHVEDEAAQQAWEVISTNVRRTASASKQPLYRLPSVTMRLLLSNLQISAYTSLMAPK